MRLFSHGQTHLSSRRLGENVKGRECKLDGSGGAVRGRHFFEAMRRLVLRANSEKFVAARSTAKRRDTENAASEGEKAGDVVARNFL
jgi:hypothetical protein